MQPVSSLTFDRQLLAYSVEKLGCEMSDFAAQVLMRGLGSG